MINKTSEKIYDVITINNKKYFIDKQINHILDEEIKVLCKKHDIKASMAYWCYPK